MKLYGTYQRLAIAGLVLGAFLMIVYNYSQVMSLEGQPLTGSSPAIKQLESNLANLEGLLAETLPHIDQNRLFSLYFSRYKEKKVEEPTPRSVPDTIENPSPVKTDEKVVLPELAGIVEINDFDGSIRYKALMDGGIHQVEDLIRQFVVKQITDRGVVLQQGKKRWFVENPQPQFSNDIGD